MMDILKAIENAGFSRWVVESSSVFAFPSILLLHTIGMGVVVGIWGPFVHGRLAAGLLAQVTRVPVPGGTRLIRIGKIVI